MTTDTSVAMDRVADVVSGARRLGVVGHVGPDGDALGSMIAIALAARDAGIDAVASFDEPFVVPDELSFLDTSVLVPPARFPDDLDVAVVVDTSVRDRVGSLAAKLEGAKSLVVIDHHVSDGSWGDVVVIDRTAGATAELVHELLERLGWTVSTEVATALYAGIVTDTGRFQYSSTSPRTHRIAAALLDAGVRPDPIGQKLFEEAPFGYYTVAARVLERSVMDEQHRLVWSVMTLDDLTAAGIGYHQTDALIDLVRMATGTQVACLLKERTPGVYKGSLRSRGEIDVAAIAREFGGGGHHNAAGFTATATPDEIMDLVVARLP